MLEFRQKFTHIEPVFVFAVERLSEQQSEVGAAVGGLAHVEDELVGGRVDLVLVDSVGAGVGVDGRRNGDAARLGVHRLGDALAQATLRKLGGVVVPVHYRDLYLIHANAACIVSIDPSDRLTDRFVRDHSEVANFAFQVQL